MKQDLSAIWPVHSNSLLGFEKANGKFVWFEEPKVVRRNSEATTTAISDIFKALLTPIAFVTRPFKTSKNAPILSLSLVWL